MTERDWLTADRPWPLWHHLDDLDRLTERKKRLFGVAAVRRVAHLLTDPRSARVIDACEAYADDRIDQDELIAADLAAFDAARELRDANAPGEQRLAADGAKWLGPDDSKLGRAAEFANEVFGYRSLVRAGVVDPARPLEEVVGHWRDPAFLAGQAVEERAQADLVRELFGNPFRPVVFDPGWRTGTVTGLARGVYADRSYHLLTVLADALQDAGCEDPDILTHCRDPEAVHVRGCWAVDLVLNKA